LSYGQLKDSDVAAERYDGHIAKLGEAGLQVFCKVDLPSGLNDPDGVSPFEAVGSHKPVP